MHWVSPTIVQVSQLAPHAWQESDVPAENLPDPQGVQVGLVVPNVVDSELAGQLVQDMAPEAEKVLTGHFSQSAALVVSLLPATHVAQLTGPEVAGVAGRLIQVKQGVVGS